MYKMNNQERENLYQFIDSVPPYLWINWIGVCGCILEFYSSKRHEYSVENDLAFFVDLLKNSELNISIFRTRFKAYIESNNGKFKDEQGNPLKKPTGENYYNDPKYIETLLPKNT